MLLKKKIIISIITGTLAVPGFLIYAAAPEDLRDSISKKAQELQQIQERIKETEETLGEVQGQSKTLQQEIQKIDKNVQRVNLSIRASEVIIDKLTLETNELSYTIEDAQDNIELRETSIITLLQEIQQREDESPLIAFLKNKSLSESIFEAQSLVDVSERLQEEAQELQYKKEELKASLEDTTDKKKKIKTEQETLKNKRVVLDETKKGRQTILVETKNQEKIYQKKLSELEQLQEGIADEIDTLEEELRLKIDPSALPTPHPGVLGTPIQIPPAQLTQKYGSTKFVRRNGRSWHNGVDFGAPIGTPLLAAERGRILAIGDQDNYRTNGKRLCYKGAYGKFIMVKHENNLTTLYAHASLIKAKIGDQVERGDIIGYSGNTGRSTGPHLHFTVYSSQTIPRASAGFPEGTQSSRVCGPLPVGGDMDPLKYL